MQKKLLRVIYDHYILSLVYFQSTDVIIDDKVYCLTVKYPASITYHGHEFDGSLQKIPNNDTSSALYNLSFCHFSCLPLTEANVVLFWGIDIVIEFKCCFSL